MVAVSVGTGSGKVKAKRKVGKTSSAKRKVLTEKEIEAIVEQTIHDNSLINRTLQFGSDVLGTVGSTIVSVTETAFNALRDIAVGVWEFLGKLYTTAADAVRAVYNWLADLASRAYGAVKSALVRVKEYISSMNVDWLAVNSTCIKLMAAAAAIGIGTTVGLAAGVTMGALAGGLGAPVVIQQATALIFGAVTAGCTYEVAYALNCAGLSRASLAAMIAAAQRKSAGKAKLATA